MRLRQASNIPDSRVYVWDIETDAFHSFDFATGRGTGTEEEDGESTDLVNRAQQAREVAGKRPVAQFWDSSEPKLLVCEAAYHPTATNNVSKASSSRNHLNATQENASTEVRLQIAEVQTIMEVQTVYEKHNSHDLTI